MSSLSIADAARAAPECIALIAGVQRFTYAALARHVAAACHAMDAWKLAPDACVAIAATNRVETVVTLLALIERGVPFVPLHPRLTEHEAARLIADAAPARVLRDDDTAALFAAPDVGPWTRPAVNTASTLAVLYTSGTSGMPKGAVLTRGAFVASAEGSAANLRWRDDDRWLLCLPLCHVGGLSVLTRCLVARRGVVLLPRFDADAVLRAIALERATLLSVVPTMLRALLDADTHGTLARLRAVLVGGAAASPALLQECARRDIAALTTYGLTEACSQVTVQRPREPRVYQPGSGRPLAGVELEIADDAGRALSPGEIGRVRVRGPSVMRGYLHAPPLAGAWFDTGDLGALDAAGCLHIHARRTDLIVTGGENVYPVEVEQALEACDGVARALVFGVPDDVWGSVVAAAIVPDGPSPPDTDALFEAMASRLAPHKRPRRVCFVRDIPLLGSGKPDRAGAPARFSPALRPWVRPVPSPR